MSQTTEEIQTNNVGLFSGGFSTFDPDKMSAVLPYTALEHAVNLRIQYADIAFSPPQWGKRRVRVQQLPFE